MTKHLLFTLVVVGSLLLAFFGCSTSQKEQSVRIQEIADAKLPREIIGKDGASMVLIPAGEFWMGSNAGSYDEKPRHKVYLDAFYMDKYEVTNAQYRRFVQETGHREPEGWRLVEIKRYHSGYRKFKPWSDDNLNGDDQPVVCVDWEDAKAYTEWAGKRLPTEAEWEKAARGGLMGKKYPWGNYDGRLIHDYVNWAISPFTRGRDGEYNRRPVFAASGRDKWEYTAPVGSFPPNGYGLYDMGGNVSEWCADWYDDGYYAKSPGRNPVGPHRSWFRRVIQHGRHVQRGASWNMWHGPPPERLGTVIGPPWVSSLRLAERKPYGRHKDLGFRCVRSASAVDYGLMEDNTEKP